jgi:two-component system, NarL family, sensor histidine kinase DesK
VVITRGWLVLGRALLTVSPLVVVAPALSVIASAAPAQRGVSLVGLVAFVALWAWFWWFGVDSPRPAAAPAGVLLLAVMLGVLTALAPPGRDALLFAALAAGAGLRTRPGGAAVAAIAILAGAIQLAHGIAPLPALGTAVNDLVVGVAGMGGRLLLVTNRELASARDEIAVLAVNEERLRMARDLHDLLGQDLTLAVLKSELVARDLPGDTPAAIRDLTVEVAATVRKSLDDLRAAVAGFRQLRLGAELASARSGLTAAGIDLSVESRLGEVPVDREEALAWALREAVTNVIRHSRARRCAVVLWRVDSTALLEVADDGVGAAAGAGDTGSGLRGIEERLAVLGGSLDAAPGDASGYRLRVSVPLR